MTLINTDVSQGKRISGLLYFERYVLLTPDLIAKLCAKETAKPPVSDDFITELYSTVDVPISTMLLYTFSNRHQGY